MNYNLKGVFMSKIIRQIEEHEVYNVVSRIHDYEDIVNGDLAERLESFDYYNHIEGHLIGALDLDVYSIDQDKVDDIIFEIKEKGLSTMPKIVIGDNGEIIDGVHRANALHQMGYKKIDLLKGTNKKYTPEFKRELIDEGMKIYKISNQFGSISVMEDAKYSPADNSISEFLVKEEYRGLGIGTDLLKEAMNQYENLGAQVSSIASLKVFLECGFEPFDLKASQKFENKTTSYDFKTFNKDPELLGEQAAFYRRDIGLFKEKMDESKALFNENGQSLYLNDKRIIKQELKNKRSALRV